LIVFLYLIVDFLQLHMTISPQPR